MANTDGFPACIDCKAPIRVVNGRDPSRCKGCLAPAPATAKVAADGAASKPARKR